VLGLIAQTIHTARAAGKGVCVCGEMAGDPEFTELLIGMGLRSFSMHPSQIPTIKQRILRADASRLSDLAAAVLSAEDPRVACLQVRPKVSGQSSVQIFDAAA
jgi:phosphotransferase system enzyme I (PtsI)